LAPHVVAKGGGFFQATRHFKRRGEYRSSTKCRQKKKKKTEVVLVGIQELAKSGSENWSPCQNHAPRKEKDQCHPTAFGPGTVCAEKTGKKKKIPL